MAECSRKMNKACRMGIMTVFCLFLAVCAFLCFGESRAQAKTVYADTPIGTRVKLVIPHEMGDRDDDTMKAAITDYALEGTASNYYYLRVNLKFLSLGEAGKTRWSSRAVFYDANGKILNRSGELDGFLWTFDDEKIASLDENYSYRMFIPTAIAGDVAAIVFQKHWHELSSLPSNPSVMQADSWENVRVDIPADIGGISDTSMRIRISDYGFEGADSGSGYVLYADAAFTSLGRGGNSWTGRAAFYDRFGTSLGGGIADDYGYFKIEDKAPLELGKTYSFEIEIPAELAGSVAKIEILGGQASETDTSDPRFADNTETKKNQSLTASNLKKTLSTKSFKIVPGGTFYTALTFKSSNTKIATVTSKGSYATVKMKKEGSVKITITAPGSALYNEAEKTITLKIILAKPKLTVKVSGGTMTVSWGKVTRAAQYQLSVAQHGVKSTKMYTRKTKLSNSITKGKKYTIKVRAVDSKKKFQSGWTTKTIKT